MYHTQLREISIWLLDDCFCEENGRLLTQSAAADRGAPADSTQSYVAMPGRAMYFGVFYGGRDYDASDSWLTVVGQFVHEKKRKPARMCYAYFRSQGFQIGSGTIESAAKQIGLMRMKVPGAMWKEENAILVAKARASFLSQCWHDLPFAS